MKRNSKEESFSRGVQLSALETKENITGIWFWVGITRILLVLLIMQEDIRNSMTG
jgi:hypothetical protein